VVWRTASEPDTAADSRREAQRRRDPEDVPDRAFYPPPKRVVASLVANDGYPFETPRWFADNKRLLLTRNVPSRDGTIRPDLFIWNAEDGSLARVTRSAALRDADPSANGNWAAAVRCEHGWCDLVRVDLATKAIRVLRAGSVTRNYYRPRVSRRTGEIVVSEQFGDRWRIARVSPTTGQFRYADPDDGVNRYDATFDADGVSVVTTSERGGFINLERLQPDGGEPVPITRVTGAAVAADVAPDGALWFLNLRSAGFDLRRIRPDSARIDTPLPTLVLGDTISGVMPPPRPLVAAHDTTGSRPLGPVPDAHRYGFGPSRLRYAPSFNSGFGGTTLGGAIARSDPVGRFGFLLQGQAGAGALPAGGSIAFVSRASRTFLGLNAWSTHEAPSRVLPIALEEGLDLSRAGGAFRLDSRRYRDGGELTGTVAMLAESQRATSFADATRAAALFAFGATVRRVDEDTRYLVALDGMGELGAIASERYARQRSSLLFGTARGDKPLLTARLAYGTVGGGDGSDRERYAVGGFRSALIEPLFDARRVEAPAYPVGSASGLTFASYRVGLPVEPIELYYAGVTTDFFQTQERSYGAEIRTRVPAIAALGTPEVAILAGFARAQDEPVRGDWQYYVSLSLRP